MPPMCPPWSPSAAREAVRRAICRYRTEPQEHADLEREAAALLRDDDAFASPEALVERTAVYIPREVHELLEQHGLVAVRST